MRDTLCNFKPYYYECGVINLDCQEGEGTHWVAYVKKGNLCMYFDSFGDLRPPREFIQYIQSDGRDNVNIEYNYNRLQKPDAVNCGHLCIEFLCNVAKHQLFTYK